ncbi:hypothetical protein M3P36_08850 [Altererythrobacter sp. KTW20L]|uniref:hypothetical protein n=1 Tax=Altererythrobacter sp. KTW20L TaxID=2942210 RepID=UPI0020C08C0D|nr:hypothetical protein [Altererythrobacter sp. KTW20L]MCL6251149.1 hypothetical protein [Altererythrobacter sp. KTW20L]
MPDPDKPNEKPIDSRILVDAVAEVKEMGRDGMAHPSTRPVLTGAAVGAVAGWILPVIPLGLGLVAGAGYMLYKRIRP